MKIKMLILVVLLAIVVAACINKTTTESKEPVAPQQAELQNETPPGTIVQEVKSQIRFSMQNPENTENIEIK